MAYDKDSFLAGLSAGRTLKGAAAAGEGGGSGSGGGIAVTGALYIEDVGNNPALGNVNFGKYKAGDVVLVVQDMAVTKEV